MNILKTFLSAKKIAIFLLAFIFAVTLVACGEQSGTPYGSISAEKTYLKIGDYEVSQKRLYDQLRTSSVARLNSYIEELVFSDVDINAAGEDFKIEAYEQELSTALFSSSITPSTIGSMSSRTIAQSILSYADSFAITNPGVNQTLLVEFLEKVIDDVIARVNAVDFDEKDDFRYGFFDKEAYPAYTSIIEALEKQYKLAVLKKVYAVTERGDYVNGEFTGDLANEDSSIYVKESDIVTYYQNNVAGRYDVTALIIPFTSVREHELARYKYAIKSNSRGEWFEIPNISKQSVIDEIKAGNYLDTDPLGKAKKILTSPVGTSADSGLGYTLDNLKPIDYRSEEFATYYSKYTINSTVDKSLDDSAENNLVLFYFLSIYDDLNGTNYAPESLDNINELAVGESRRTLIEEAFKLSYDSNIFKNNAELRSYVYGLDKESLYYSTKNEPNEDGVTFGRPYSRQVQTFNSVQYLVYLLDDNREADDDVLDESDPLEIVFAENDHAQEVRLEAIKKLVDSKLTASYISSKASDKIDNTEINIYDPIIRDIYANSYTYKGSYGFLNNDVLAKVGDKEITVDEFFERIEPTLGLSSALDLIFMDKLREMYKDEINDAKMAEFREQFENQYVNPFLANSYETAGFPASIGLEKFLLLGFGAWARDGKSSTYDAIDKIYVQTELRKLFEEDLTKHFPNNTADNNIYKKLAELANKQTVNEIGVTVSHLLIHVDFNNDGSPDKPTDALIAEQNFKGISTLEDFEKEVQKLVNIIVNRVKSSQNKIDSTLSTLANNYTSSSRYTETPNDFPQFADEQEILDYIATLTPEQVLEFIRVYNKNDEFVPFKRLGIKVKYESLGEITNQRNFPSNTTSSSLDEKFLDYALKLGSYLKDMIEENNIDNKNEVLPVFAPLLTIADGEDVAFSLEKSRTAFGWHLILVTDVTLNVSAEVLDNAEEGKYDSKIENPYAEGQFLTALNDSKYLSWEQILIHIEESKTEEGVVTLPTDVKTAISKYFTPVQTAYNSSYSQLEIAFRLVFGDNVQITNDATLNERLQILRNANFNQFFGYSYFDGYTGNGSTIYDRAFNHEYAAVYGDWFDILNG